MSAEKMSLTKDTDRSTQTGRSRQNAKPAKQGRSSLPSATAVCDQMSNYKSSLKKKGTSVLHEDLLLLSNQHKESGPGPPTDVSTAHYSTVNGYLRRVYWKQAEKQQLIDGYKVFTSADGKSWKLKMVCDSKTHHFSGLPMGIKIGVCSFKDNQDSEIIVSKPLKTGRNPSDSAELYKSNSYVFVKHSNDILVPGGIESPGSYAIIKSNVKMVPLKFHKVLCTPIKLTALDSKNSDELESKSEFYKSVKYCFCLEADLVNRILNSKEPSWDTYGVQVFLRFCLNDQRCIQEDVIPYCMVKVNNKIALLQVKDKHSGPVDITHLCNFTKGKDSEDYLLIEWVPSMRKRYCMMLCVAEKLSIPGVVSNLLENSVKDQSITTEMVQLKFEFDKDISCTSLKASLICPLGQTRLVSPCRGSNCTHIQCMDALTLLKMNQERPTLNKKCYMCDQLLGDVYIDGLFLSILSTIPECVNEVEFKQDGSWVYDSPEYSGPSEKKLWTMDGTDVNRELQKSQSKKIPEDRGTDNFNESESDILSAMNFHLSKLKSHLDLLDNMSTSHEQFKDVSVEDDMNLVSHKKDDADMRTQGHSGSDIEQRQTMDCGERIDVCDKGTDMFIAPKEEINLISDAEEENCRITFVENQDTEGIDNKASIERLYKEREMSIETETKIEKMIAKMLKKVKKNGKDNETEDKKKGDDLVSVSDDGGKKDDHVEKNVQSTDGNFSILDHQCHDGKEEVVHIDLDMDSLAGNASKCPTSPYKCKEDGTLSFNNRTNLERVTNSENEDLNLDNQIESITHSESNDDDETEKVKNDNETEKVKSDNETEKVKNDNETEKVKNLNETETVKNDNETEKVKNDNETEKVKNDGIDNVLDNDNKKSKVESENDFGKHKSCSGKGKHQTNTKTNINDIDNVVDNDNKERKVESYNDLGKHKSCSGKGKHQTNTKTNINDIDNVVDNDNKERKVESYNDLGKHKSCSGKGKHQTNTKTNINDIDNGNKKSKVESENDFGKHKSCSGKGKHQTNTKTNINDIDNVVDNDNKERKVESYNDLGKHKSCSGKGKHQTNTKTNIDDIDNDNKKSKVESENDLGKHKSCSGKEKHQTNTKTNIDDIGNVVDNDNKKSKVESENDLGKHKSCSEKGKHQTNTGTYIDRVHSGTTRVGRKIKKPVPFDLRENHLNQSNVLRSDDGLNESEQRLNKSLKLSSFKTKGLKDKEMCVPVQDQNDDRLKDNSEKVVVDEKDNTRKVNVIEKDNSKKDDAIENGKLEEVDAIEKDHSKKVNLELIEKGNAQKDDAIEKDNSRKTGVIEKDNSREVDVIEKDNSKKVNVIEKGNAQKDDAIEKDNSRKTGVIEKDKSRKVDVIEKDNSKKADMIKKDISRKVGVIEKNKPEKVVKIVKDISEEVKIIEKDLSVNVDLIEKDNSEKVGVIEKDNSEKVRVIEKDNSEKVGVIEKKHSEKVGVIEKDNSEKVDVIEKDNSEKVSVIEKDNSEEGDVNEKDNSDEADIRAVEDFALVTLEEEPVLSRKELLGRAKRKRRGKKKLMIDEIKELTQVQIRHQVMIDSFHNKQKMDIAPSTKYLMRSTGSGIKRIRKKSRAGAEDVLRHPSLPLPKKLRNLFERNLVTVPEKETEKVSQEESASLQSNDANSGEMTVENEQPVKIKRTRKRRRGYKYRPRNLSNTASTSTEMSTGIPKANPKLHQLEFRKDNDDQDDLDASKGFNLKGDIEADLLKVTTYAAEHGFKTIALIYNFTKDLKYGMQRKYEVPGTWTVKRFIDGHPELEQRLYDSPFNEKVFEYMSKWYDLLKTVLTKYEVLNKANRIFSCDKLKIKVEKFASDSDVKGCSRKGSHGLKCIHTHICVCANGRFLLPDFTDLEILKKNDDKNRRNESKAFLNWFKNNFLQNCGKERPVCLLMVNCVDILSVQLLETAIRNAVVLIGFPLYAAETLQPLKNKILGRLNTYINKCIVLSRHAEVRMEQLKRFMYAGIKQHKPSRVQEAFRACGICPLGQMVPRKNINPNGLRKEIDEGANLSCKTASDVIVIDDDNVVVDDTQTVPVQKDNPHTSATHPQMSLQNSSTTVNSKSISKQKESAICKVLPTAKETAQVITMCKTVKGPNTDMATISTCKAASVNRCDKKANVVLKYKDSKQISKKGKTGSKRVKTQANAKFEMVRVLRGKRQARAMRGTVLPRQEEAGSNVKCKKIPPHRIKKYGRLSFKRHAKQINVDYKAVSDGKGYLQTNKKKASRQSPVTRHVLPETVSDLDQISKRHVGSKGSYSNTKQSVMQNTHSTLYKRQTRNTKEVPFVPYFTTYLFMNNLSKNTDQGATSKVNTRQDSNKQGTITQNNTRQGTITQDNTKQGTITQGITKQGTITQDNTRQGTVRRDNTRQGTITQDNTRQGATSKVKSRQDNIKQGTITQDNTKQGTITQNNARQGTIRRDNTRQGTIRLDNTRQGTITQGNTRQGTITQENTRQGSITQENTRQGATSKVKSRQSDTRQGTTTQDNTKQGTITQENTRQYNTRQYNTRQDPTKQDYSTQDNTRQDNTKQDNTMQDNTKQDNTKQDNTKQGNTKQDNTKQDNSKQDNSKQNNTKQDNTKQDNTKQDNTKQNNTKQDNTKQDNTKQDNTKQDNTKQDNSKQDNSKQNNTKQDNTTQDNIRQYNTTNANTGKISGRQYRNRIETHITPNMVNVKRIQETPVIQKDLEVVHRSMQKSEETIDISQVKETEKLTVLKETVCEGAKTSPVKVQQEDVAQSQSGVDFGVNRGSVMKDLIQKISKRDNVCVMTYMEEKFLLNLVMYMLEHGFPMSLVKTCAFVKQVIHRFGRKSKSSQALTRRWVQEFFTSHPEIAHLKHQMILEETTPTAECISNWFTNLEKLLTKYEIKDKPGQIYSFHTVDWDCSDFMKIKDGGEEVNRSTINKHVSASLCVCADGSFWPSTVVFQGLLPSMKDLRELPSAMCYATSEFGCFNNQIFLEWFQTCFIPNCGSMRPVCLLLNNMCSLLTVPIIEAAVENDVVLVGIPSHAASILHPIEAKISRQLNTSINTLCKSMFSDGTITSARFPALLEQSVDHMSSSQVKQAFQVTGVCPFNQCAIEVNSLTHTDSPDDRATFKNSKQVLEQGSPEASTSAGSVRQKLKHKGTPMNDSNQSDDIDNVGHRESVIDSGKTSQSPSKRKLEDAHVSPIVCLKRMKININGHPLYS